MIDSIQAARFLISLDSHQVYFNNCDFYEGNARLNKMLHFANNMYIGKHNEALIRDPFYAYNNGGVIPKVQENYSMLLGTRNKVPVNIDDSIRSFLKKVYIMLKDAPLQELIDIDNEDPAWKEKRVYYYKEDQKMDSMKYADVYRDMYEAANFYLDKMVLA